MSVRISTENTVRYVFNLQMITVEYAMRCPGKSEWHITKIFTQLLESKFFRKIHKLSHLVII